MQVGDNAINAMLRAALAKEVALWRSQFGAYIAFTRNDFNKCFTAAFMRVQVKPPRVTNFECGHFFLIVRLTLTHETHVLTHLTHLR